MNSIHDLGGMHGMGPLPFEANEPIFHEDWERLAFGVNILLLMSGIYNADESRHAMEKIPALHWLEASYYEHWIDGLERILFEKGYLTEKEVATGRVDRSLAPKAAPFYVKPEAVAELVATNHQVTGAPPGPPKFKVGDKVRAKNWNPRTHTRLPRYVRGRVGSIAAHPDAFVYADTRAHGMGDNPQHTYSVRFEGGELWGPDAGARDAVYIDLYETYLESA